MKTSLQFPLRALVATCLLATAGVAVLAQETLTNADVVKMVKAQLGDQLVIAKIRESPRVDFKLEVDDLIALKKEGISQPVIKAMLDRENASPFGSSAPAAGSATAPAGGIAAVNPLAQMDQNMGMQMIQVALSTDKGVVGLHIIRGHLSSTAMGWMHFMDYPGLHARVRTSEARPTLLVKSDTPLTGGFYFIARLDVDKKGGVRSLKISSAKNRFKAMFGNSRKLEQPDQDWVIPFTEEDAGNNIWKVTPKKDLKPGEYGWYVSIGTGMQQTGLYPFGVDQGTAAPASSATSTTKGP